MLRSVHEKHEKISAVMGFSPAVSYPPLMIIFSLDPACPERCPLDLPGFTNLEGLPR